MDNRFTCKLGIIKTMAAYVYAHEQLRLCFYVCCGASVASEQQHNQDLRRIYRRGYEFSNSSLFTRMHCS